MISQTFLSPYNYQISKTHVSDFFKEEKDPTEIIKRYKEMVVLHNGRGFSHLALAPVLKACSKVSALSPGRQIHAQSVKFGFILDVFVQTSLISMYSSCEQLDNALNVFDKMPQRNIVTWTSMMDSFIRSDQLEMALAVFRKMQKAGIKPDNHTIVSLLTACSRLSALNLGKWAHAYTERMGMEITSFTGTALIDMYCKCGCVNDALAVFNSMKKRKSVHSWNAIIHGLSVNGRGEEALKLFKEMEMEDGVRPNEVTFIGVLSGSSHNGLVEEGQFYFNLMRNKYGIFPTIKHCGCMVDLLARAGLLDEAFDMAYEMSVPANVVVWGSLLSACRNQNNVVLAERVSQVISGIEDNCIQGGDTSHYVIMSNIYANAGLKGKMAGARAKIGKKPKGQSWVEIGCHVHEFAVGDTSHPMWGKIREMLEEIVVKIGSEYEQLEILENPHSEMLAVSFGLLTTSIPATIRIVKNLRICSKCHAIMKIISEVYGREIIVRDCTRYHRFVGGRCTCKDYW